MPQNSIVRVSVDENIKREATEVLADAGLTVSDAFRLLLTRIAKEKTVVFDPLIPNAETLSAMNDAREGNVKSFNSIEELFEDLNAPN